MLVATAHIHWDPEFCDVKLIQTMMMLDQLRKIIQDSSLSFRPGHKFDPSSVQLLLCGDLNSLPESGESVRFGGILIFNVQVVDKDDGSYDRALANRSEGLKFLYIFFH